MAERKQVFQDYYLQWVQKLKKLHSQLKEALQCDDVIRVEAQVEALRLHFESHYDALDRAARQDVLQVLTPAWRTPLEKPYLWIGDWHPALFINLFHGLVAHYLDRLSLEPATSEKNYYRRGGLAYASEDLLNKVENIRMVLRTMVPALFHRMRRVQLGLGGPIAKDWLLALLRDGQESSPGSSRREDQDAVAALESGFTAQIRELTEIFLDANQLRKNIFSEIVNAADVYQAAQYLQGLVQFQISLRDPDLEKALKCSKLLIP